MLTDRYLAEVTGDGLFAMSFMDDANLAASVSSTTLCATPSAWGHLVEQLRCVTQIAQAAFYQGAAHKHPLAAGSPLSRSIEGICVPNQTTFAMREDTAPAFPPTVRPVPKLAVLVPTRNEAANIEELLRHISAAVTGIPTEIVFIDDSGDDTPAVIRSVARRRGGGDCQVSLIHPRGGRGQAASTGRRRRPPSRPVGIVGVRPRRGPPSPPRGHPAPACRRGGQRGRSGRGQPVLRHGSSDGLGPARALISTVCG